MALRPWDCQYVGKALTKFSLPLGQMKGEVWRKTKCQPFSSSGSMDGSCGSCIAQANNAEKMARMMYLRDEQQS